MYARIKQREPPYIWFTPDMHWKTQDEDGNKHKNQESKISRTRQKSKGLCIHYDIKLELG